ncbi:TPA: hypothetical protein N0F65_001711 [Lagenidium giganteum]|uniref:Uncharacterized protein n=1 Tax=Lagenidium giganteum TaxID=4803 RepID=A0AAV2Z6Y0_9STRA|nr:TPA: hypothetical protein N0F65_001711 [Lagenidium giganteum]
MISRTSLRLLYVVC